MQKRSLCVTEESSDNFVYLRQWTYDVFIAVRTCLGFDEHLRTFNLVNDYLYACHYTGIMVRSVWSLCMNLIY